jgi:transcriptional regulator with XRE-family HTH domain
VATDSFELALVEERAVARIQAMAIRLLTAKQMNRTQLAKEMGVTASHVSQLFADEPPNLSVKAAARLFYALDERLEFTCAGIEKLDQEAAARNAQRAALCEEANAFAWLEDEVSNDVPCSEEIRDLVAA